MRRRSGAWPASVVAWTLASGLLLGTMPGGAQQQAAQPQGQINPRLPPPPPVEITPPTPPPQPATAPAPPADVPDRITLAAGTAIDVVLDTPLSTRIARQGQAVTFRTAKPMSVDAGLEIPPETPITGTVTQAKKPGGFGAGGEIRVKIDRIGIPALAPTPLVARLEAPNMDKDGRVRADNQGGTNMLELAQYTILGTMVGGKVSGGKGMAIGAGAGALAALIIMMSRRGQDVYLEPGMPFVVVLEQAVELPGPELYATQQNYYRIHPAVRDADGVASGTVPAGLSIPEEERPKLKRRPK